MLVDLVKKRQDVRHFLRVKLRDKARSFGGSAATCRAVVPKYRTSQPMAGTGALSREYLGQCVLRTVDGMADTALLVTKKQRGAFAGSPIM